MCDKKYKEISCEIALNRLKRRIPYSWDLNIYRGCEHGCKYCYAIYSHDYLGSENYHGDIYVKINIVEQLEKQLSNPIWKREIINIGGITDSYQPAEARYRLMPEILKLLIKYKNPAIISTKSKLVLRDYELINELSKITYINIAATVTVMDESIRSKIEPGTAESNERFEVLKTFRKTNASIGLHVMPIIPLITDKEDNFESMFTWARTCNVDYVLTGTLYLRGNTRSRFFCFLQNQYPDLMESYRVLYKTGGVSKEYKTGLYTKVNRLRDKYRLSSSYMKAMSSRLH